MPLLTTLSFSTNSYFLVGLRPGLIWLITSILGLSYLSYKSKNKYPFLIALVSFLPFFLSLTIIGQTRWEDYWGPMYVPLMAIFSLTTIKVLNEN
ncbi:unnamed protein product [marine sediment metagenome]|uniref:Uncharacterized protein n=1 Tax=marine sediment metagenome TaxID=412755 RepID=X0X6Q7_9ZZZZ